MKTFVLILALVCLALPAFGKTHMIWVLGTEPLFEKSESRAQFFAQLHKYPEREKLALKALDIDRVAFERGMRSAPSIVTNGPFHLDAMTYYNGGVKVARDVDVPAHTWMWVVHLPHKTVYVPQACGNISSVPTASGDSFSTALPGTAPQRAAMVVQTPEPLAPSPQVALATTPIPAPTAAVAAVAHHRGFPWWIFLVPIALIHGNNGSTDSTPPPIVAIPSGHPSSSPTPSALPSHSPTPTPSASMSPPPTPTPSASPCHCPTPTPTPKPTPTPCPSATRTVKH